MGDSRRFAVFDPFVLAKAVSGEVSSDEYAALEVLKQKCANSLVVDDEQGRLGTVYKTDLKGIFPFVQTQLLERLQFEEKIVLSSRVFGIGTLQLPRRSHIRFARSALALRPTYLVTQIPNLLRAAEQLSQRYNTWVVSPADFISRELR